MQQLIDIGANIGTTTVEILHRLPGTKALALEPEPRNFALLQHNVIANDLSERVTALRLAASDTATALSVDI